MSAITEQILHDMQELPDDMQQEALDFIQRLSDKKNKHTASKEGNGKKISAIMQRIAARGSAFSQVEDPVAWQKNNRKDRSLPFRDK